MGKVNIIGKWNIDKNKWNTTPEEKDCGKSFSYATYDTIINDENNDDINYIIIANGTRLEQHTKNKININDKELLINYVINKLKKENENYEIITIFMDSDAPLIEEAKLFSTFIDTLSIQ